MTAAPLRKVVRSKAGPACQKVELPDGVLWMCGPKPYAQTLECGHTVVGYGRQAKARRCEECRVKQSPGQLALDV
jgi:hypothetical protein